jgi:hypothetical protein
VDHTLVVGRRETVRHRCGDVTGLLPGQSPIGQLIAQGLPLEQLGDRVGDPFVGAEIPDLEDVRVGQLGHGPGLALEPHQPICLLCYRLGQHLDRHLAVKPLVVGAVHLPHPTRTERLEDLVASETVACREGHL